MHFDATLPEQLAVKHDVFLLFNVKTIRTDVYRMNGWVSQAIFISREVHSNFQ